MNEMCVQFQGEDSDRVENFLKCAKPGTAFILTHYVVGEEEKDKEKEKKTKPKPRKLEGPAEGTCFCHEIFGINDIYFQLRNELRVLYWKILSVSANNN